MEGVGESSDGSLAQSVPLQVAEQQVAIRESMQWFRVPPKASAGGVLQQRSSKSYNRPSPCAAARVRVWHAVQNASWPPCIAGLLQGRLPGGGTCRAGGQEARPHRDRPGLCTQPAQRVLCTSPHLLPTTTKTNSAVQHASPPPHMLAYKAQAMCVCVCVYMCVCVCVWCCAYCVCSLCLISNWQTRWLRSLTAITFKTKSSRMCTTRSPSRPSRMG